MHPNAVKALVLVAMLAILAVAAVPMVILLDLTGDGTGWGMCEDGISSCRVGNFRGPRLAMVLMLVLIGLAALLRFIVWVSGLSGRPNRRSSGYRNDDLYIP
ncbi:MAG: hypothetical protein HKO63_01180 [Acidimicrobiia bacterium]|nr:hypothetical protein [Acidimicrobiia bacterium]MBT8192249.1 hypothetical protein [Acidimicrobiia bacterium]NNF89071.1 hypothetical protein [Acidimicrobiia bacterium]NNL14017.1 hypothetical protein [Acidimicrobiia bacterium]NNL96791.1 hypothetical protein [Acidimicrobiia bacterium]